MIFSFHLHFKESTICTKRQVLSNYGTGVKFNINKKSGTVLTDSSTFLFILSQKWSSQGILKDKYSVC